MKRKSIIALIFVFAAGISALYVMTDPREKHAGQDPVLREIAGFTAAPMPEMFDIEKSASDTAKPVVTAEERGVWIWFKNMFRHMREWVSAETSNAPSPISDVPGCDPTVQSIALDKVLCLEKRRVDLNRGAIPVSSGLPKFANSVSGDAELFYRMMTFVKTVRPDASAASSALQPTAAQMKILNAWRAAGDSSNLNGDTFWRDQKYFFRYATHLALGGLIPARTLTSPEDFLSIIQGSLSTQTNVAKTETFAGTTRFSFGTKSEVLGRQTTRRDLVMTAAGDKPVSLGFVIENTGAPFAFIYNRDGLTYDKIPGVVSSSKRVVADFPGPMHADGARLIELGIRSGRVINFLMGGGARRSGLVVVTPDGRAYPFHVQAISPSVWGSKSPAGTLDLSRSYEDLRTFLTLAKDEKLSVFMEMLLAEEAEANVGLTPIKNFANARGRRLLVWKHQGDGQPSLLVVNDGLSINHAVWAAHQLGYRWAINLDCDFIDGARYVPLTAAGAPVAWGTPLRSTVETSTQNPYSRLLFFDEK